MRAENIIDVNTGEVNLGKGQTLLRSLAIGSCVAIAAYDSSSKIGALAHVMLPGSAPNEKCEKNKYADDAIDDMIARMESAGSQKSAIEVCLVGAGNVLKKQDDKICSANIESITQLLNNKNIPIRATALGGTKRRGVFLDVEKGTVWYTKGDDEKKVLWQAQF